MCDKRKKCGSHLSFQEEGKYSRLKNFSKIPKPKKGQSNKSMNIPNTKHALACIEEKDNSFQLYITKVYVIKDNLRKDGLKEEKLDDNVAELANKISALCHKIKDVESCMFIGSNGITPQIKCGPQGDIGLITNDLENMRQYNSSQLDYTNLNENESGFINENDKDLVFIHKLDSKCHKNNMNSLNANASQLFCSMEFSCENMFGTSDSGTKTDSETRKLKFDFKDKSQVTKVLEILSRRTEEIMRKISTMEIHIRQMKIFKDVAETNEIFSYCKIFFDELLKQKLEISEIVDTLKSCIENMPSNFINFQEQIDKLTVSLKEILNEKSANLILQNISTSPIVSKQLLQPSLNLIDSQNQIKSESSEFQRPSSIINQIHFKEECELDENSNISQELSNSNIIPNTPDKTCSSNLNMKQNKMEIPQKSKSAQEGMRQFITFLRNDEDVVPTKLSKNIVETGINSNHETSVNEIFRGSLKTNLISGEFNSDICSCPVCCVEKNANLENTSCYRDIPDEKYKDNYDELNKQNSKKTKKQSKRFDNHVGNTKIFVAKNELNDSKEGIIWRTPNSIKNQETIELVNVIINNNIKENNKIEKSKNSFATISLAESCAPNVSLDSGISCLSRYSQIKDIWNEVCATKEQMLNTLQEQDRHQLKNQSSHCLNNKDSNHKNILKDSVTQNEVKIEPICKQCSQSSQCSLLEEKSDLKNICLSQINKEYDLNVVKIEPISKPCSKTSKCSTLEKKSGSKNMFLSQINQEYAKEGPSTQTNNSSTISSKNVQDLKTDLNSADKLTETCLFNKFFIKNKSEENAIDATNETVAKETYSSKTVKKQNSFEIVCSKQSKTSLETDKEVDKLKEKLIKHKRHKQYTHQNVYPTENNNSKFIKLDDEKIKKLRCILQTNATHNTDLYKDSSKESFNSHSYKNYCNKCNNQQSSKSIQVNQSVVDLELISPNKIRCSVMETMEKGCMCKICLCSSSDMDKINALYPESEHLLENFEILDKGEKVSQEYIEDDNINIEVNNNVFNKDTSQESVKKCPYSNKLIETNLIPKEILTQYINKKDIKSDGLLFGQKTGLIDTQKIWKEHNLSTFRKQEFNTKARKHKRHLTMYNESETESDSKTISRKKSKLVTLFSKHILRRTPACENVSTRIEGNKGGNTKVSKNYIEAEIGDNCKTNFENQGSDMDSTQEGTNINTSLHSNSNNLSTSFKTNGSDSIFFLLQPATKPVKDIEDKKLTSSDSSCVEEKNTLMEKEMKIEELNNGKYIVCLSKSKTDIKSLEQLSLKPLNIGKMHIKMTELGETDDNSKEKSIEKPCSKENENCLDTKYISSLNLLQETVSDIKKKMYLQQLQLENLATQDIVNNEKVLNCECKYTPEHRKRKSFFRRLFKKK